MKIAIMQPYLFPYIGYFSLIKNTDFFVFFDTPQYIRKGWINRNRILSANGDITYFTVPIQKADRNTPINKIIVSNNYDWKMKTLGQLNIYKKAPNYGRVIDLVKGIFNTDTMLISDLAIKSIVKTCEYLDIDIKYDIFSKMNLALPEVKEPDEWALYITKELGYNTYINPPGGMSFFNREKYQINDVDLQFLVQEIIPYRQNREVFIPALSMIDVMMFCSCNEINEMLCKYKIER
ncbi:WbqC-like protein [Roseburia inulinivorans DSM 16841]|uniref:WbqC-like protein n=1 Tax=Roseburia inulinivorans DSM 16841 TaxID=622312 RepID=C0FNW2_9FIRM|nr:WbqC family protein [Roseburia inulinivorans]EEG95714.1 WbqC-like protein [Roseburia inulinivorans DSM 16841]MCC3341344.1 WbqC family protein [Roseburia inulinivorans DSM 16841]